MSQARAETRIQRKNKDLILEAALEVFSTYGFRGSTLDQIATQAGLSKPNLLYYFPSKESVYKDLLDGLLDTWLDPLRAIDPDGEPTQEILGYMQRKLEMSRLYPRESRLFANEILQGAPRVLQTLKGDLKDLVDEKSEIIKSWSDKGLIADVHPQHLLFSIWSLTQHYADFDVQIQAVLGDEKPFDHAPEFLRSLYERLLKN